MHNYRPGRLQENQETSGVQTVAPSLFKRTISDSLKQSLLEKTILFIPLGDWVYMLAVPPSFQYSPEETHHIAKEIQQSILPGKHPEHHYQVLGWPQIANTHHLNQLAYKDWELIKAAKGSNDAQLVFFIDTELIRTMVHTMAEQHGFHVDGEHANQRIVINDGQFEEHIDLVSLASESLWVGEDVSLTIGGRIRGLRSTFRHFHSLFRHLKKAFPDASFWHANGQLYAMLGQVYGCINYRAALRSSQFANQDIETWLQGITLKDLLAIDEHPVVSVRAPAYLKVRPQALCKSQDGFLMVTELESEGRLKAISQSEPEHDEHKRFTHYFSEAKRRLPEAKFSAHVYVHEDPATYGAAFIGDKISSIALFPELVAGALQSLGTYPRSVRVLASFENVMLVVDSNAPWELIEELEHKAQTILNTLFSEGSDPLHLDRHLQLPEYACGDFDFLSIPAPYFELIDAADDVKIALPPGRADYLRGLAFELIHEWRLAVRAFRKAFSFDTNDGDISYALGRAMTEEGHFEDALIFLERAFEILPEDPDVANSLGLAYLECEQKENAARLLEHAVDIQPDDVQILSNLGRCYFANKKFKEAELVLTRALEYAPNFSEAHATLAQIRWRLGDVTSARKHARRAFAANPSNKCVQDLLWALTVDDDEGR